MESLGVVKRPVITEKSMLVVDERRYTLEVDTRANKTLAKQAVGSAFDVGVANIDILSVRPKFKRMGKYVGYAKKRRRTIITLTEDSKEIQLFEAAE